MRKLSPSILPVITGPTASGKTRLAAHLAHALGGEIISADSRQVYRGMDLGTGKDLDDYIVEGSPVPYHLIDIMEAGQEYNVFAFLGDFHKVRQEITKRGKQPLLCGGSGMYVEAAVAGYRMEKVPENKALRRELETMEMDQLTGRLEELGSLHNTTDTTDRKRLLRAIEIAEHQRGIPMTGKGKPAFQSRLFAIFLERRDLRERITRRLELRLQQGMAEEVERLLARGIGVEKLHYYGLEYRHLASYVTGQASHGEMFSRLNTAIHQFAKRQMTWFRRMEKRGISIHWLDGTMNLSDKVNEVLYRLDKS